MCKIWSLSLSGSLKVQSLQMVMMIDGDGEDGIGDGFDHLWLVMVVITCKGHEVVGALPGHELSLQLIPPSTAVQHRPRHLPNENPWGNMIAYQHRSLLLNYRKRRFWLLVHTVGRYDGGVPLWRVSKWRQSAERLPPLPRHGETSESKKWSEWIWIYKRTQMANRTCQFKPSMTIEVCSQNEFSLWDAYLNIALHV